MICYFYPPKHLVGTWRSLGFARFLPEFSWLPTVLTAKDSTSPPMAGTDFPDVSVVRTREWNIYRLADFLQGAASRMCRLFGFELKKIYFKDLLNFPDEQIGWFSTLTGVRLARSHDLVYVSCSPFSSAISACWIKFFTRIPIVLDFRDAWYFDRDPSLRSRMFLFGIEHLERWTVSYCDILIVNTHGARTLYEQRYPHVTKKIRVIPNGYDELHPAEPASPEKKTFTIIHIGNFYGTRNPEVLMEALLQLNDPRIEFIQVGNDHPLLQKYQGTLSMKVFPQVSRNEALQMMQTASLLYLRQGMSNPIAIAGKTLEYLATGLPILGHCPLGDNSEMLEKYAKHRYLVHSDSPQELKHAIENAIADNRQSAPEVLPNFVQDFDRRELTRTLARLFDELTGQHSTS